MPVTYNSFSPALSSVILVVSSDGEFVTTQTVEEFAAIEAFEHLGDEFGPGYTKLASLATKQQRALEKVQNMLDESDDMLGEEMDRTKTLTENLQRLQSKFDNLQSHHNTLLSNHEKHSYEFLQRSKILRS